MQTSCGSCLKHSSKRGAGWYQMLQFITSHHPTKKTLLMLTKHPLARVSATNHKNQLIRQVRNSGNGTHESNETSQASYLFLGFILWFLRQHDKALVMPHPQLLAPSQASSPPEGHRQQSTTQTARILYKNAGASKTNHGQPFLVHECVSARSCT